MKPNTIVWKDERGVLHACEGSNIHPGILLLWTRCQRDVPANTAFRSERGDQANLRKMYKAGPTGRDPGIEGDSMSTLCDQMTNSEWRKLSISTRQKLLIYEESLMKSHRQLSVSQAVTSDCGCINHIDGPITFCPLHNAASDLLAELRDRSQALGGVKILLLQNNLTGAMEILDRYELVFTDGPIMVSPAIAKAEPQESQS